MFKVSKRQNAILLGLAITALVAIFCYQVAYGMTETVTGPYGITGTITAANGTKFTTKPTVTILNSSNFVRLDNTTWKFDTNNMAGKITFHTNWVPEKTCMAGSIF
jgi:hypothetical protein